MSSVTFNAFFLFSLFSGVLFLPSSSYLDTHFFFYLCKFFSKRVSLVEFEIFLTFFLFSFPLQPMVLLFSVIPSTSFILVLSSCLFLTLFPLERGSVPPSASSLPSRTYSTASYYTHGLGILFFSHLPTHVLVVVLTHLHRTYYLLPIYLSTYLLPIVPAAGYLRPPELKRSKGGKEKKIEKIALAETYITFVPLPITLHPRTRLLIYYYYYYIIK